MKGLHSLTGRKWCHSAKLVVECLLLTAKITSTFVLT